MFRKEFVSVITNTGMMTLKELRPFMLDKNEDEVDEFKLLNVSHFDDKKLAKMICEKFALPYIDLSSANIPQSVLKLIKKNVLRRYRAIPVQKTNNGLTVCTYDPTIKNNQKELRQSFRAPVEVIITSLGDWKKLYDSISETVDELVENIQVVEEEKIEKQEINSVKEDEIGEDVILKVNKILAEAYVKKASDIHIEPYEHEFRIRYRIDGKLYETESPGMKIMLPLISRIKIMAQMDISEKRKPQDGRIKLNIGSLSIDYRVSSMPTLFGEKIVLRLLDKSNLALDMTELGFEEKQLQVFKENISKPFGMCLVTGPTGSGKSTTLYSALKELNKTDSNISTAEDPVEFNVEGINQVNIKNDIGLTFESALKTFLRQDPDIIMVGEIRNKEVGETAIEASLTGHLVLSTLHTNDAPSTISRLVQMGIADYLLTSALNVIVAQRLCRRICDNCRQIDQNISVEQIIAAGVSPNSAPKVKVYRGAGCEKCNDGYKGRVAIHEVLPVTAAIRDLILKGANSDEIKLKAMQEGMKTLRMAALTKVAKGITTLEEAINNSASDKF